MSGGGSGGSGTQTTKWEPPDYAKGGWEAYLSGVQNLSQQPLQQYGGQQTAELNPYTLSGLDMTTQLAINGTPLQNSAAGYLTDSVNGKFMGYGPGANSNVRAELNPYFGPNPYLDANIQKNAQDMTSAFQTGTAAQTDAMFNRSNAFGGSAYNQMQQGNAANLAREIGGMTNAARMQDYTAQQGLGENAVNRDLAAQQFNVGTQSNAYEAERARMQQAAGLAPTYQQGDLQAAQALTGVGDAYRTYEQQLLDNAYNQYQQAQQYPITMSDLYANALARASGGMGTNTVTTQQNGGNSTLASLLGGGLAGLAGYSLLKNG